MSPGRGSTGGPASGAFDGKAFVAGLPNAPGVYRMLDASGKVITPGLVTPFGQIGLVDQTGRLLWCKPAPPALVLLAPFVGHVLNFKRIDQNLAAPFSAMRLTWIPERPGNWLFHCHLIRHMGTQQRVGLEPAIEHDDAAGRAQGRAGGCFGGGFGAVPGGAQLARRGGRAERHLEPRQIHLQSSLLPFPEHGQPRRRVRSPAPGRPVVACPCAGSGGSGTASFPAVRESRSAAWPRTALRGSGLSA